MTRAGRRLVALAGVAAMLVAGVAMTGRNSEFGFWQSVGLATGTHDDLRPAEFATLERRETPNDALVCPAEVCPRAKPDFEPPVFPVPADRLLAAARAVALAEPRTLDLYVGADARRLRFVQRSLLLRYPDVVDVLIIPRGDGASTLAMWSRSAVGRRDFGVNRARLERWLAAIARQSTV